MKIHRLFSKLFVIAILSLGLSFTACCEHEDIVDDCIDESSICETCPCTQQYDPVCGCDNVTYGNSCEAEVNGVTEYTEGECTGG